MSFSSFCTTNTESFTPPTFSELEFTPLAIDKFGLSLMFEDNKISFIKKKKKINLSTPHTEDIQMSKMIIKKINESFTQHYISTDKITNINTCLKAFIKFHLDDEYQDFTVYTSNAIYFNTTRFGKYRSSTFDIVNDKEISIKQLYPKISMNKAKKTININWFF